MAQVVVRDLLESVPEVSITAADRRPVAHPDPRVRFASADASDESATARLLEGHDAVLNCVTYYFNVPVMRAALAARVPYADLGGLYHGSVKQFALHDDFRRAGGTALLGMGSTPASRTSWPALSRVDSTASRRSTCGWLRRPIRLGAAPGAVRARHRARRVLARAHGLRGRRRARRARQ
jgi:hypothetical protein